LCLALIASLGTEFRSRNRKNSGGVIDSGGASSSEYGRHILHLNLSDLQSQPEQRESEDGWKWETEGTNGGRVCFSLCLPVVNRFNPSCRKEDLGSALEDSRARFYEHYRKEAEEYDKEFMKKHDEDLNTTLIFVRCAYRSGTRV